MSRFFAGSDSENDSSSSEEEDVQQKPAVNIAAFQFSDEEVEEKRVVRSAKEKRYEGLNNNIKQIKNYKKIKDVSKLLTSFEELQVNYHKARPVIDKEEGGVPPRFFIRCLVEIEDFVTELWEDKEGKKNMQKNSQKSLANLRQKVRKYLKDFETDVQRYRENPDAEEDERDEDEDQADSDSEDDVKPTAPTLSADAFKKSAKKDEDDDISDDESDWGSSTDEESSLSTDDEKYGGNLAAKFLKRTTDKDEDEEREKKKEKKKKDKEERKKKRDAEDEEGWEEVKGGAPLIMEKPKMFAKDAEISHSLVLKKLNEILAARGKKGTDRSEQIELLTELMSIGEVHNLGPAIAVKIQFAIISAIFDYNPNIATCMKSEMWARLLQHIQDLLARLQDSTTITIGENIAEESEILNTPPYRVRGCVLTVVERMEEEFIKILQACDAHSHEYVERLKDEKIACDIVEKIKVYLESGGTSSEICRVYLRSIEHLYYKFDPTVIKQKETGSEPGTKNSLAVMNELCQYVYAKDTTDRIRTRAMLCNVYHHALHDNWYEARDLMLMSHLQDSIVHSDIPTQLLYNRTMVQLGLCAFRHGNIKDSHNCLLDIQSGGRAKELLAQGLLLQRQHERSSEQEKIEKRRQMPFHMHINLELLECVYLVSAMLMEIPYMAAHELDTRRRMISKSFHHQLKNSEKQALVGPPESMREHVVAASKAMRLGNWRACKNYIFNEKMNAKVWDLFYQADKVRDMLTLKIQEESLRTYLFTYSNVYDSISMVTLAEMFELDKATVHSIISKMIINEELMASLDEPSQTVMMHRTEPSRLQSLALQLADKVANFVENNERILEMKQGPYFNRNMGQQGGGYQRQDRGGYNRNYQNQDNWQQQNYQRGYNRNQESGQQQNYQRGYNRNQESGQQQNYQRGYNRNQESGNQRQDRGGQSYGTRNQDWNNRNRQRNY